MVSVGTILSLGIIGAIAIGGYAVYRNLDKVGGALSRGLETSITNPLGDYFDNLWAGINNNTQTTTSLQTEQTQQVYDAQVTQKTIEQIESGVPTQKEYEFVTDPNDDPAKFNPPNTDYNVNNPYGYTKEQKYKEGYYYFNFEGAKYDYQVKLSEDQAKSYSEFAAEPGDSLLNLQFLGLSKLSDAGFNLFGQSKNYL